MDVSIVIVSYNVRRPLEKCLWSLLGEEISFERPKVLDSRRALIGEIIVVDSDSSDGTADMIKQQFPFVKLVTPGTNVGYSRGNNLGMERSSGSIIVLLNPDTEVVAGAIPDMVSYLRQNRNVGLVGPQLLNPDGTIQPSRRRFPSIWTALFESTWLQGIAPRQFLESYYVKDISADDTMAVDWVTGAAMAVRREVIDRVGGFDEGYFMYSEELDWQHRINRSSMQIMYYPGARIIHYGGKSSEQAPAATHIRFQSSKIRYFTKYHGKLVGGLLRYFLLASYWCQFGIEFSKQLVGHKRELRHARMSTYWQVIHSGLRG